MLARPGTGRHPLQAQKTKKFSHDQELSFIGYSGAHLGKTLLWVFFDTFFMFFAIYHLGLDPVLASLAVLLFSMSDVLLDIPAGFLIGKQKKRLNGMMVWAKFATPLCCMLVFIAFFGTKLTPGPGGFWICIAGGCLFRVFFTFLDVPLNAVIGQVSHDSKRRNRVSAGRNIGGALGRGILALLIAIIAETDDGIDASQLWLVAGCISLFSGLLIFPFLVTSQEHARHNPSQEELEDGWIRFSMVKTAFTPNLVILICVNTIFLILVSQVMKSIIFLVESWPGSTFSYSSTWLLIVGVGALTVIPWMNLASRYEKTRVFGWCMLAIAATLGTFLLTGISTSLQFVTFIILLGSVFHANTFIWSMLPDVMDEASLRIKKSCHAALIAIFASLGKLTIGIGTVLNGFLLEWSGFPDAPDFDMLLTLILGISLVASLSVYSLGLKLNMNYKTHQIINDSLAALNSCEKPAANLHPLSK